MKDMGLKAYRFSISWSRVLPEGIGRINEDGLSFYSDLVDELLKAGIEPFITLFHWDLPQALYDKGGWRNRDISDWFAQYTKVVVDALSDRVSNWMTLNEPLCHILLGHYLGEHAPGEKVSSTEALRLLHNMNLAHGKAVQTIRKHAKKPCNIGVVPNPYSGVPATDTKEDLDAPELLPSARPPEVFFPMAGGWTLLLIGEYPKDGIEAMGNESC